MQAPGSPIDERPLKRRRTLAQTTREVGLMRNAPGEKPSGFVGSASGIHFIRSVYNAFSRAQSASNNEVETPGSEVVPGEDDHLPTALPDSSQRLWRIDEISSESSTNYSFQDLIRWSGSYFTNWHTFYPFLHAPTVLDYFAEIGRNGLPQNNASQKFQLVVLKSIMSISLADQRQARGGVKNMQYPASLVFLSYDAAVDSLRDLLAHPTSIPALQAAISVQLFLVSMLRSNAASRLGGLVNRMTIQLGLHRCPARFSSFSAQDKEMRQRIFWSVYTIDRFVCQSMGLPLGINDDDVDVCWLSVERHLAFKEHRIDERLRFPDLVARHARIRGEIVELRNKSIYYVQKDPDQATAITAKLTQWWNDVEELKDSEDESTLSAYHVMILSILRHESVISLFRPMLAAQSGAAYDAALHDCIGSARAIITTLYNAVTRTNESQQLRNSMILLWPSLTWAVWISTFVLFYAAHSKSINHTTVARLAEKSLLVLQHIARRGTIWPDASAAAIRDLSTRMLQSQDAPTSNDRDTIGDHMHRNSIPPPSEEGSTTSYQANPIPFNNETQDMSKHTPQNFSHPELRYAAHQDVSDLPHATNNGTERSSLQPPQVENGFGSATSVPVQYANNNIHAAVPPEMGYDQNSFDIGNGSWIDFMQPDGSAGFDVSMGTELQDAFSGFDIPFWIEGSHNWDIPRG